VTEDEQTSPVFESREPGVATPVARAPEQEAMQPATPEALAKLRKRQDRKVPGASRGMVLGWCLWLLGSWGVLYPTYGPVWAVRGMILAALIGLMVIWPLVRLSESPLQWHDRAAPRWLTTTGVLVEWLSLIAVFQAVVWPLRVTGDWGLAQTLWLDGAVVSWTLITAAMVALGVAMPGGAGRSLIMATCVLLLLGEPLVMAMFPGSDWDMRISPLQTVWALTDRGTAWQPEPWSGRVTAAALAAAAAWAVVGLALWRSESTATPRTT
jgi:hypothetical protein